MSDKMYPLAFEKLMNNLLSEYDKTQTIFGIQNIFRKNASDEKLKLFGESLELPFGVSSGPHTQLAQNIISAYAAGARYIELKTVQMIDGTSTNTLKPSVSALDEGYNIAFSTELTVEEAMGEYIKAWYAIKLISREFQLGDENGFIFNMSVGYDLESVKSDKLNKFIEGLKNASTTQAWNECKEYAFANLTRFKRIDEQYITGISDKVCTSVTLSANYNCKIQEIEEISKYLLLEKKLHLYLKCPPTIVGYDVAKKMLNNMGYGYINFDDKYFVEGFQIKEAIPMFKRLLDVSKSANLKVGVKISSTLKVNIKAKELEGEEMSLSGKALYPIAISAAKVISTALEGKISISYCGGADIYNTHLLAKIGLWPVTMATTLLKPGGYNRLSQIATSVSDIAQYESNTISPKVLDELSAMALKDIYYKKPTKIMVLKKRKEKLPIANCYKSPCKTGCPAGQDIPAYIRLSSEGKYAEALRVIIERNPLPNVTSLICPHPCAGQCTRNFYDKPVSIRQIKADIVQKAYDEIITEFVPIDITDNIKNVAIVGGGPAGMSAAYFLAKAGIKATIFEKSEKLGGMISQLMPEFKVPEQAIENDIEFLRKMGVKTEFNTCIDELDTLKYMGFTHIILAMGAWSKVESKLMNGEPLEVMEFLRTYKENPDSLNLGDNVTVMAGGNTAITAARAAKRLPGVKAVRLICPTEKRFMAGDEEEIELAQSEGVEIWELLQPLTMKWRSLDCRRMIVQSVDQATGKEILVDSGSIVSITSDTIISAVGEKIDDKFYRRNRVATDEQNNPYLNISLESMTQKGTYVIGDGNRGPATVIEAIADAQKAVASIIGKDKNTIYGKYDDLNINPNYSSAKNKKGILCVGSALMRETEKCLECQTVCENCVDVCPNRANIAIEVPNIPTRQIVHIDAFCNGCGNCNTFCVYNDMPNKNKLSYYMTDKEYQDGNVNAFMVIDKNTMSCKIRVAGASKDAVVAAPVNGLDENIRNIILAFIKEYSHLI